jgi:hypothetical protein
MVIMASLTGGKDEGLRRGDVNGSRAEGGREIESRRGLGKVKCQRPNR